MSKTKIIVILNNYKAIIVYLLILFLQSLLIAENIPESARSREVISRVAPGLERDMADAKLSLGAHVYLRIFKKEKELELYIQKEGHFILYKTYPVCTWGQGSLGPKLYEGDGQAPEGFYFAVPERLNPVSNFHLSFDIGYPNEYDRYHQRTGSLIMVHGSCVSLGCFAMTDPGIEEIYTIIDSAFRNGQKFFRIHIFPFRMTPENLEEHRDSEWYEFWLNLRKGYDRFEENGNIPPNIKVRRGKYIFESL